MVSCGKRGSLLVAGPANTVAANQPPAAATASDDIQNEAECMISSGLFLRPGEASPAALAAPAAPAEWQLSADGSGWIRLRAPTPVWYSAPAPAPFPSAPAACRHALIAASRSRADRPDDPAADSTCWDGPECSGFHG